MTILSRASHSPIVESNSDSGSLIPSKGTKVAESKLSKCAWSDRGSLEIPHTHAIEIVIKGNVR